MSKTCKLYPEINGKTPPYTSRLSKLVKRDSLFALFDAVTKAMKSDNAKRLLVIDKGMPTFESLRPLINLSKFVYHNATSAGKQFLDKKLSSLSHLEFCLDVLLAKTPTVEFNGEKLSVVTELDSSFTDGKQTVSYRYSDLRPEDYFFNKLSDYPMSFNLRSLFNEAIAGSTSKRNAAMRIAYLILNPDSAMPFIQNDPTLNAADITEELNRLANTNVDRYLSTDASNYSHWYDFSQSDILGTDYSNYVPTNSSFYEVNTYINKVMDHIDRMSQNSITRIGIIRDRIFVLADAKKKLERFFEDNQMTDSQREAYNKILKHLGDSVFTYIRRCVNIGEHFNLDDERDNGGQYALDEKGKKGKGHTYKSGKNKYFNISELVADVRFNGNNQTTTVARLFAAITRNIEKTAKSDIQGLIDAVRATGRKPIITKMEDGTLRFAYFPLSDFEKTFGYGLENLEVLFSNRIRKNYLPKFLLSDNNHIFQLKKHTWEISSKIRVGDTLELNDDMLEQCITGTMANLFQDEIVNLSDALMSIGAFDDTNTIRFLEFLSGKNRSTGNEKIHKIISKAQSFYTFVTLGYNVTSGVVNAVQGICNGLITYSAKDNPTAVVRNTLKSIVNMARRGIEQKRPSIPETFEDYVEYCADDADTNYGLENKTSRFVEWGYAPLSVLDKVTRASCARTILKRKNIEIDGVKYSYANLIDKYGFDDKIPDGTLDGVKFEDMTMQGLLMSLTPQIDSMSYHVAGPSSSMYASLASKTILGKMLLSMRRWMIALFHARYSGKEFRPELGVTSYGYVRQLFNAALETIKTRKNQFKGDGNDAIANRMAARMMGTELVLVGIITAAFMAIDFPDEDDEEKEGAAYLRIILGNALRDVTSFAPTPLMYSSLKDVLLQPIPFITWSEGLFDDVSKCRFDKYIPLVKQIHRHQERNNVARFITNQQRSRLAESNLYLPGIAYRRYYAEKEAKKSARSKRKKHIGETTVTYK